MMQADFKINWYSVILLMSIACHSCQIVASQEAQNLFLRTAAINDTTLLQVALTNGRTHHTTLIDEKDQTGKTALFIALVNGHFQIAQRLLEEKDDLALMPDNDGNTPLHILAVSDCSEIAIYQLFQWNRRHNHQLIDINAQNKQGHTPLMVAISAEHIKKAKAFLTYHPDVMRKDQNNESAMSLACRLTLLDLALAIARRWKTDEKQSTALHIAAQYGPAEIVKKIIEDLRPDLEAKDCRGRTALFIAKTRGNEDIIDTLTRQEASSENLIDNNGKTPEESQLT